MPSEKVYRAVRIYRSMRSIEAQWDRAAQRLLDSFRDFDTQDMKEYIEATGGGYTTDDIEGGEDA